MGLERKTLFERIEMDMDGNISVLLKKAVVDGEQVIAHTNHRVMVPAGQSIDDHFGAVTESLGRDGYPSVPPVAVDLAKAIKKAKK